MFDHLSPKKYSSLTTIMTKIYYGLWDIFMEYKNNYKTKT